MCVRRGARWDLERDVVVGRWWLRLQGEFRELWPELDTPNELASQIIKHLDGKLASKREVAALPLQLQMVA
jgi:hypothetical protein